jgi:hypothetical protein
VRKLSRGFGRQAFLGLPLREPLAQKPVERRALPGEHRERIQDVLEIGRGQTVGLRDGTIDPLSPVA